MLEMLCKLANIQSFTAATVIMLETGCKVLKPAPAILW